MSCEYGYGLCKTSWGECPHFKGLYCELDMSREESAYHYTPKAQPKVSFANESEIKRDCSKCVYEVGCKGNPVGCKRFKRDAPDGGYYG